MGKGAPAKFDDARNPGRLDLVNQCWIQFRANQHTIFIQIGKLICWADQLLDYGRCSLAKIDRSLFKVIVSRSGLIFRNLGQGFVPGGGSIRRVGSDALSRFGQQCLVR